MATILLSLTNNLTDFNWPTSRKLEHLYFNTK